MNSMGKYMVSVWENYSMGNIWRVTISVFEIKGKFHYRGQKDITFMLRHIVTECDMLLAIFLDL